MKIKKNMLPVLFLAVLIFGCNCNSCGESETAPTTTHIVSSTDPADGATDVFINRKIAATFSGEMDPNTITETTFTLRQGTTLVAGAVTYSGVTAIFSPASDLTASTEYTSTITTGVADLEGLALASEYTWSFTTGATTDTTAPTITSTDPANSDVNVLLNRKIAATFSEAMDALTITADSFIVTGPDAALVSGTVDYVLVGNVATFTPTNNLAVNTTYTVTVTTAATDLAGNALASAYVWSFTTGADVDISAPTLVSTNPANADVSVALNKTITATFNETMDALTITTENFLVTGPGTTPVIGTVGYDLINNIASFNPGSDLTANTEYTATITTGSRDLANNALANDYVWSFTTGDQVAQLVIQEVVPLGVSSNFAILASAAITNIATSAITGDVGLTPDSGSNISGFSVPETCPEITGTLYAVDAAGPACAQIDPTLLTNAKTAAEIAFIDARDAARGTPQAISGNLNGLTLYPGLFESGSSLEISPGGFLYLDAQGDTNAVFVIRSATSITTEASSEVVLTKGAKANNVYWTAGSTVTLGTNSIMKGTLMAGTSLSLLTGANLEGRALNQGAAAEAVTLDSCVITIPSP